VLLREALDALGRQDVRIEPLRGNLDTRLRKLDEGQYHAIVLASAGLKRLNLKQRIRHIFEPIESLPAAGQGALGIEVRADRADLVAALAPLVHMPSWLRVAAERTVSRAMGGSCSMPLAAYADWAADGSLRLDAAWGDPEGVHRIVRVHGSAPVQGLAQAEALGQRVAQALRSGGAQPLPAEG
jgi:hydroxymethylbilane synthase